MEAVGHPMQQSGQQGADPQSASITLDITVDEARWLITTVNVTLRLLKTLVQLPAVEGHNRRPVWRRNAKQSGASLLIRCRPSLAASDTSQMVSTQRFANSWD